MILEPHWDRTCSDCQTWIYEDDPKSSRYGLPMVRGGSLVEQYDPPLTPCVNCPKIPDSVKERVVSEENRGVGPQDAIEPDWMHRGIVQHFLECDAVRHFPLGDWVARHAGIIRPYLDAANRRELQILFLDAASRIGR